MKPDLQKKYWELTRLEQNGNTKIAARELDPKELVQRYFNNKWEESWPGLDKYAKYTIMEYFYHLTRHHPHFLDLLMNNQTLCQYLNITSQECITILSLKQQKINLKPD